MQSGYFARNAAETRRAIELLEKKYPESPVVIESRLQLADYLNCDRSALSRELSLMQKDGLLDTFKSSFKLLDPDALKQMVQ